MEWLQRSLDQYGGAILGVLLGAIAMIVIFATMDGQKGNKGPRKRGDNRPHD
ncbi:MAG: hypothetical protein ABIP94_08710 [Planctomycetota bacterium]